MKFEELQTLKREVIHELNEARKTDSSMGQMQDLLVPRSPESRIALGYSLSRPGDYNLEIRVQRSEGLAFRVSQRIQEKNRKHVNIEIIPRIQIAPKSQIEKPKMTLPIRNCSEDSLQIGLSIGHKDGGAGTLGAFIERLNGSICLLSCSHVIANMGRAEIGDYVFHPGREPDLNIHLDATRRIARLTNFIDLARDNPNDIDAAYAQMLDSCDSVGTRIPQGLGYPNEGDELIALDDYDQIALRDTIVCKIGRTSGYTRGMIRAVELESVTVNSSQGNIPFTNVIEVRSLSKGEPFSLPGDSGSLVFTENGREAFGIIFAGGHRDRDGISLTYICRLDRILQWADARLLVD